MALVIISKLSFFLLFLSSLAALTAAAGYGNVNAPNSELPGPDVAPSPYGSSDHYKAKQQILHPLAIAVQGIVYCKSGTNKLTPLKGALARITCLGVDEYGYETAPFSMLSYPTDEKGYFYFTTLSLYQLKDTAKISECKAFLESSPLRSCDFPTDINKGQTGALLSSYRMVDGVADKKTKLYSVGPFVYASQDSKSNSYSNGY